MAVFRPWQGCLAVCTLVAATALPTLADVGGQPCLGSWLEGEAEIDGLVFGTSNFELPLDHGLRFSVERETAGWDIQIWKHDRQLPVQIRPSGIPPHTGAMSPQVTEYVFGEGVVPSEEMIVPGGPGRMIAPTVEPEFAGSGRILFETEEQHETEITNEDGSVIQTGYLDFKSCVVWNVYPRELDDDHYGGTGAPEAIAKWKVAAFEDCGLPKTLKLSAQMFSREPRSQAILEPDLDGDGATDLFAITDGANGKAVHACLRKGRELKTQTDSSTTELSSDILDLADYWSVEKGEIREDDARIAYRLPDKVWLGIEGASIQRVSLSTDGLQTSWQGD